MVDRLPPGETHYQLTHDYLVPPLTTVADTETGRDAARGRAELELAGITSLWREHPEAAPAAVALGMVANPRIHKLASLGGRRRPDDARRLEALPRPGGRLYFFWHARSLMALCWCATATVPRPHSRVALAADFTNLPDLLPELALHRALIRPKLETLDANPRATRPHDCEVAGILLYRDQPTPQRAAFLRERLAVARPDEVEVIRQALAVHPNLAGTEQLRQVLVDETAERGAAAARRRVPWRRSSRTRA